MCVFSTSEVKFIYNPQIQNTPTPTEKIYTEYINIQETKPEKCINKPLSNEAQKRNPRKDMN